MDNNNIIIPVRLNKTRFFDISFEEEKPVAIIKRHKKYYKIPANELLHLMYEKSSNILYDQLIPIRYNNTLLFYMKMSRKSGLLISYKAKKKNDYFFFDDLASETSYALKVASDHFYGRCPDKAA